MARFLKLGAVLAVLASAFVLYAVSYETRRLAHEVNTLVRKVEMTSLEIAVLKAERAYLARPDRIEKLARTQGLRPIEAGQYEVLPTRVSGVKP